MGATPHSFLVSNAKAVLVASVISWHFARCGENGYCIPTNEAQTSLRATIGTGPGLVNTLPKILGSSTLSGLMLLPGCVRGGRSDDRLWAKIGLTLLPALFTQFVIAPSSTTSRAARSRPTATSGSCTRSHLRAPSSS